MNSRCLAKTPSSSASSARRQSVGCPKIGHVGLRRNELKGRNLSRNFILRAATPDPEEMKKQYEEAMKNPEVAQRMKAMEEAMQKPEVQQQMQQTMAFMQSEEMQKKMQALQEDEELKPMFEEMKAGGMGAFMKYWNDPTLLRKLGEKLGPMPTSPPPTAQAPPPMQPPPEAEINDIVDAAKYGDLEAVEDFLAIGKDPNSTDDKDRTPMHFAAATQHMDIMDALVGAGAGLEMADAQKNTPLHYAAGYGRVEALKRLLDNGADATKRNGSGKTALDLAKLNEKNPVLGDAALMKILEEAAGNSPVFQDQ